MPCWTKLSGRSKKMRSAFHPFQSSFHFSEQLRNHKNNETMSFDKTLTSCHRDMAFVISIHANSSVIMTILEIVLFSGPSKAHSNMELSLLLNGILFIGGNVSGIFFN